MSDVPFNLYGFVNINGTGHIGGVKDIFTFGAEVRSATVKKEEGKGRGERKVIGTNRISCFAQL